MTLIVAKKDGLSIKGVGHQVDIPHGKELPEKILADQYPFETTRFRDALIRSGHVVEHAHKTAAPADGGAAPEPTKAQIIEELKGLGVEITKVIAKEKHADLIALLAKTKADIAAKAELIDNPEVEGQPTGDVAPEGAAADQVKTDVAAAPADGGEGTNEQAS